MSEATDRRRFVATLTGIGVAGLAGLAAASGVGPQPGSPQDQPPLERLCRLPWPYREQDAGAAAQRAFATYPRGGCMLAVFDPIVRTAAERLGAPYTAFPFGMFTYGAGGVAGWGTPCGALNGAAAAFSLLSPQPTGLISALFAWYEREALPEAPPAGLRYPNVPAVAGSVLCHASIAAWCRASGKRSNSPERAERCGALSGSVAAKAVTLLNAQATRTLVVPAPDQATAACLGCHGAQGNLGNVAGRMTCAPCHTPSEFAASGHPKV